MIKDFLILVLKGIGMGAANVIPGVSGGTIALITGIFERLINAIKSFNFKAIKLLFSFQWKAFADYVDLRFLIAIFIGIIIAIKSLAQIFGFLFENYPVYIWAYFFGLVLASVYFVGKTVEKWKVSVIVTFIIGTAIAIMLTFLDHAAENHSFIYLILCGVAAICSMILPGLSGSFVLLIMGNYKLVAIDAINNLDFAILFPVIIGAVGGLIVFSHFLSWIFKKFRDDTISLLTGFILGSLSILWPWQEKIYLLDKLGNQIIKNGDPIVSNYVNIVPKSFDIGFWLALLFIFIGIMSIWVVERGAQKSIK